MPTESYYSINDLLSTAKNELVFLNDMRLITDSSDKATELIAFLTNKVAMMPKILCHGDYSDVNILQHNSTPIIIDWEDAFYGIQNYDYLFWLSFFGHRKYYSAETFGTSSSNRYLNIAILTMILIIKEAMSVYNGEYKSNKLSAEDRISEILSFL